MSLTSPLTMLAGWVVVPGLVALLSWGLGCGIRLVAGMPLGALTLPVGFAGGAGIGSSLLKLGLSGPAMVVVLVLLAVAGPVAMLVLARREGRPIARPRPSVALGAAGLAGLAAYAIGVSPLVGSGRTGVAGYVLSNDPAVHLSVVALIADGTPAEPSSLQSVSSLLGSGYPLGSYVWPVAGELLTGIDPFLAWTPLIALASAMTALAAYAALRMAGGGQVVSAAGGALVASAYLPFSYLAQGGAKEVALATSVLAAVTAFAAALERGISVRSLVPAALATTGAMAFFGPGALAFLGPPAVVAALLALLGRQSRRARIRAGLGLAFGATLSFAVAAPALVASTEFVNAAEQDTRDPNEVGNLVGPVPVRETLNVWLGPDYRFPTPDRPTVTAILAVLAAALAVAGVAWALRRRSAVVPLLLLGSGIAAVYTSARYSVYFEAKTFVVLAVAVGLATATGVVALLSHRRAGVRRAAIIAGVIVALGAVASDAAVYRGAWMTPKDRFQELVDIDERYAGQGPALVVEREDYAKYLLRRLEPWESYGFWQPDRGLIDGLAPVFHSPDLDDYGLDFLQRFRLLVERKRPGASLPPTGFSLAEETSHYRVWRRTGDLPEQRVRVSGGETDSTAALDCAHPDVRALIAKAREEGEPVRALMRDTGVLATSASDWAWFTTIGPGPDPAYVTARDKLAVPRRSVPPGRYRAWVRGQLGPGLRLYVGDYRGKVGEAFGDLGQVDQWIELGEFEVKGASGTPIVRGLERPPYLAGSNRADLIGGIAFEPAGGRSRVEEVPAGRVDRELCGRHVDWLELP